MRFAIRNREAQDIVCLRDAIFHARVLRMSLPTAAVVGSILTAINQGSVLADGTPPTSLAWKVPLTYSVPFFVSTWGALRLARVTGDRG